MYYYNYLVSQPKEGVLLFDSYYDALKKSENEVFLASLNLNLGVNYLESNNRVKAMECFKIAIEYGKTGSIRRISRRSSCIPWL
jgi:hypothetical protein